MHMYTSLTKKDHLPVDRKPSSGYLLDQKEDPPVPFRKALCQLDL